MKQERIEELADEAYLSGDEDGVGRHHIEAAIRKALAEEAAQRAEVAPTQDAEDAARYRWLKSGANTEFAFDLINEIPEPDWDDEIDRLRHDVNNGERK
jgi:hypothetical protein